MVAHQPSHVIRAPSAVAFPHRGPGFPASLFDDAGHKVAIPFPGVSRMQA